MELKTKADRLKPSEPHPVLPEYYQDQAQRPAFIRGLFDRTARHYDRINRLLSLGSGGWYRRRALLQAGLRPGMRVLDVATGTGLLARQAVQVTGNPGAVIGLDVSTGMLAEARRTLPISLIQGAVEQLPLAAASIDFLTMGYALRHVADLNAAFQEFQRVLRAPGTLLILEISRPPAGLHRTLLSCYLGRVIPWLSRWTTGQQEAQTLMRYYWETIERCVPPETILQAIANAGFAEVSGHVEFGLLRVYIGRKV